VIAGILLAAGSGTRFGGAKLWSPAPCGLPLAVAALRSLGGAGLEPIAVIRPGDQRLAAVLEGEGARTVACRRAGQGMGHSLACGVAASVEAEGWLVALADMPCIDRRTVGRLACALREGAQLVAPVYRGVRGHPVGFSRRYRAELLALRGDRGARPVLEAHARELRLIPVDDPGVLWDVDRPLDAHGPARPALPSHPSQGAAGRPRDR